MNKSIITVVLVGFVVASTGAVPPAGCVIGWGSNLAGESTGTAGPVRSSFSEVLLNGKPLTNAVEIATGMGYGLALLSDGTVAGWGGNPSGACVGYKTASPYHANGLVKTGGAVLTNIVAISAGRTHSAAVRKDGMVICWGEASSPVPVGLNDVTSVSCGNDCTVALRRNGTVVSWGKCRPPAGLSNIVAIAAGAWYSAALRQDGTVVTWSPDPNLASGSAITSNALAIVAGENHCLALLKDGTVFGWGRNGVGEATGVPTKSPPAPSYYGSGKVVLSGKLLTNAVSISAGPSYSCAVRQDGSVVWWGDVSSQRATQPPSELPPVISIAAGDMFCLAIVSPATRHFAVPKK